MSTVETSAFSLISGHARMPPPPLLCRSPLPSPGLPTTETRREHRLISVSFGTTLVSVLGASQPLGAMTAGHREVIIHALRHPFATLAIDRNIPIATDSGIWDHSNTRMISRV